MCRRSWTGLLRRCASVLDRLVAVGGSGTLKVLDRCGAAEQETASGDSGQVLWQELVGEQRVDAYAAVECDDEPDRVGKKAGDLFGGDSLGCAPESFDRSSMGVNEVAPTLGDVVNRPQAARGSVRFGFAAGSNVSFDDIAVVSARSELLQLAPSSPVGECTLIVNDGRIGQTWDWFIGQLAASIVWRTPRFVAFAEAGMPPKIGVNSNGVAVTLTFLSTRLSVDPAGVPVHAMLHHLLEHSVEPVS